MKRALALILALVMLFCLFAACSKKDSDKDQGKEPTSGSADNKPSGSNQPDNSTVGSKTDQELKELEVHPSDKTITLAVNSEPNSWQQLAMSIQSANVANQTDVLYDTLINYDSTTGGLLPNLATEWDWVDDLTLRLKLRDDVTSINGDKFTASDVVFCIKTGCANSALSSYYSALFDPEKCAVVDDYTVDIAVLNKYPFLPLDLSHCAYQISVEASVNAAGGIEATKTNPISGTGAYKLVEHADGQYARFERRDDYWGTMPYYKEVVIWFVNDAETRGMGLEAGDYDFVYKPSSSLCDNLSGDSKYKVWYTTNEQVVILPMNTDREPFNVKEVRQAVALAINYDAILQIACGGHGVVTDSPWSPSNSAYSPVDESKPNYLGRYDPEEAKKLLTEAGYADGFEFTLTYRTNDSVWVKSAEIIANNLQAVNIKVELEQIDSASFYPRSESGDFDSLLWSQQNPNPRRMIQIIDERYTQCNTEGGWLQPGYQELFDKAIYELDDELRNEYFAEVTDLVRDEVPLIPLVQVYTAVITRSEVVNYTIDSYGNPKIETMYEADYLA